MLFHYAIPTKPLRLLDLPPLAHDVVFLGMDIEDLYYLSKSSTRSRNAVKIFARRQKYSFEINAKQGSFELLIQSHCGRDQFGHELRPTLVKHRFFPIRKVTTSIEYWTATKEEIVFIVDVFSGRVKRLYMEAKNVLEITEFVKSVSPVPIESVDYSNSLFIDGEIYKYVLKEFKDAKELEIGALPSSGFRSDQMEPVNCEYLYIKDACWVTVEHLARCFSNVERVKLGLYGKRMRITPQSMQRFFNAWRKESRIRELDIEFERADIDLRVMLKNVPTTEVNRVEVRQSKNVFKDGECFLIRQDESGVEAVAYWGGRFLFREDTLSFTTDFRLLRDDEIVKGRPFL